MSTYAATVDAVRPSRAARGAWIESPGFDLLFFAFAPLLVLPVFAGVYLQIPWLANGGGIALSFVHYISSYAFYFWGENKEYYRSRWIAFFAGPVLLAAILFGFLFAQVPYIIQIVLFFWNTFHVARQNCGILSVYRHRAGVFGVADRNAANTAILAVSGFLAIWNIDTHPQVAAILKYLPAGSARFMIDFAALIAIAAVIRLAIVTGRRFHAPNGGFGIAEAVFLLVALTFFYPYIFIHDSATATFVMLQPHYIQYLALVWLLHRRKFGAAESGAPRWLRSMSASSSLLVVVLAILGAGFYIFYRAAYHVHQPVYFDRIYLLVAFEHFYIDGLVWSFKKRHIRDTVAPYLLRGSEPASVAA